MPKWSTTYEEEKKDAATPKTVRRAASVPSIAITSSAENTPQKDGLRARGTLNGETEAPGQRIIERRRSTFVLRQKKKMKESHAVRVKLIALSAATLAVCIWLLIVWDFDKSPTIYITRQTYDPVPYVHINNSEPIALDKTYQLYHVAKEFGPASMGGLGTMLTALAVAQRNESRISVNAIIPAYSYLFRILNRFITPLTNITVDIQDASGYEVRITCPVYKLRWTYQTEDFLTPIMERHLQFVQPDMWRPGRRKAYSPPLTNLMDVLLIGPGDRTPFHVAFQAESSDDIYSAHKPLPQEWKDLYFAKAAANLIVHLQDDPHRAADIVQFHGATNAMALFYLRLAIARKAFHEHQPALVYTLHDYLDELEYSNKIINVQHFVENVDTAEVLVERGDFKIENTLDHYVQGSQIFPSSLGIDMADVVNFVSQTMAADITEGKLDFYLKELVMPSLLRRAKDQEWFGITNGLDFRDENRNPFLSRALTSHGATFPRVGLNLTDVSTMRSPAPTRSGSRHHSSATFIEAKTRAKTHLVKDGPNGWFSNEDLARPIILFVGRFQYNKGCDFFEPILQTISNSSEPHNNARLIVMGAHNNFPRKILRKLETKYPDHFTLIDHSLQQKRWGPTIRMASDYALVPSFAESFGLIAAEGLFFGTRVISSGVGGLSEFLYDDKDGKEGNAYLFNALADVGAQAPAMIKPTYAIGDMPVRSRVVGLKLSSEECIKAVKRAIADWRKNRADVDSDLADQATGWFRQETRIRTYVQSALDLRWNREDGPIAEYNRMYQIALRKAGRSVASD